MNIYERPTPRTDEAILRGVKGDVPDAMTVFGPVVDAAFARKLEQELETCRDAHMANCLASDTLRTEIRELRERLADAGHKHRLEAALAKRTPAPEGDAHEHEETLKRLRSMIPGCDCENPSQCWEECGTLGHSDKHVQIVGEAKS